ncbi:MAG: hypothetical protein HYX94_01015 [Chloroflexi bacterium]|nr:hypothetical protein [Chloroflexota bacterium]
METKVKVYDPEEMKKHIDEWVEEALDQAPPQSIVLAGLRARLDKYEEKFGRPSEGLSEAVGRGEVDETHEVCRWLLTYRHWLTLQNEA